MLLVAGALPGWMAMLCAPPLFFFLSRLALIGHDAGHGSLTASTTLNRWLGRIAFLPSLHPYSAWVVSHNALHHAFTNLRGKDPLWAPLTKEEFDDLSPPRRVLERVYRTPIGVFLYYLVEYWWKVLLFPHGEARDRLAKRRSATCERLAVLGFLLTQCSGLVAWQRFLTVRFSLAESSPGLLLVAGVLLPFLMMCWMAGMVGLLHHTHPRIRWYADRAEWCHFREQIEGTVHLLVPWPLDWLMGHSLEHTAHHVDPRVPFPALADCQRRLEESCASITVQRLTLGDCLRILAACKLYDYQRHCWLDYDGRPTTRSPGS